MKRLFVLACVAAAGCHPRNDPPAPPADVSPAGLVTAYRDLGDTADHTWTGQSVRVTLPAGGYTVGQNRLFWHTGYPDSPPVLVFELGSGLPDNRNKVSVAGVCRGRVHDGVRRAPAVHFYVRVTDCSATAAP